MATGNHNDILEPLPLLDARHVSRSGARSPRSAPISPETSASINCCTTQESDSRRKSSPSPPSR
jgi:hypothetical protein